jgi:hypothetical protein
MEDFAFTSRSLSELAIVQNPALGAYTIWRFGLGFQSDDSRPAALPLAFLVLPLVLHRPTLASIGSTQRASGLALFASKLSQERENLLAIHERALLLRSLTLQSIAMGVNQRLLSINYAAATIRANTTENSTRKIALPERLKAFSGAPEKIGYWFSKLGLHQIASILSVDF